MARPRTFDESRPARETRRERALYALTGGRVGRRRKPDPPVVVTVVLESGESVQIPAGSPIGKAMGEVARALAHW
jgi:hypothetical protein